MASAAPLAAPALPAEDRSALALDFGLVVLLLLLATVTGCLVLLAEAARSGLTVAQRAWRALLSRPVRGPASACYAFGIGKLEQAGTLVIALAAVAAALWIASATAKILLAGSGSIEPGHLAFAAAGYGLVTLRSALQLVALRDAAAPRAEIASEARRFASLLLLQATLTLAVLVPDHLVALWAEVAGPAFLSLLIALRGASLLRNAVLDLIDYPLHPESEHRITQLLFEHGLRPEELIDLRCRRAGRQVFAELTLEPKAESSGAEAAQRLAALHRALEREIDGLDLVIRLPAPAG